AARQRLFEHARRRALRRLDVGLDLQWTPPRSRDAVHEREPSQAELIACSPTSDLLTPAGVGPGLRLAYLLNQVLEARALAGRRCRGAPRHGAQPVGTSAIQAERVFS